MKKIVIFSLSLLFVAVLGYFAYSFVNDYIQASGPTDSTDKPYIMMDGKLYTTDDSCAESAFNYIASSQGFALVDAKITKTVKNDVVPTKDLSTNYSIFKGSDIYKSETTPNEIYIKAAVKDEVRFYRFVITSAQSDAV